MRIISWNVNGYRAVLGKDFVGWLSACGADVVMLQETNEDRPKLGPFG